MGSGGAYGGRQGAGAARFPGLPPIIKPELAGLTQAGPNGEIYDPESFFNVRGRGPRSGMDRLSAMAQAARNYRGGLSGQPGGPGFGVGAGAAQSDVLRRLLEAQMGGGF